MQVDVAIVGAGPAGCSSALSLLSKGHSVAVVAAPNRKVKPTETATPALKQLLRSLGAETALSACEPCFGICSDWGSLSPALQSSVGNPFGDSWFIHRSRFDQRLQQLTQDAGAIWKPETVRSVDFDAQGVVLHTSGEPVRARWMISAMGSPFWSARITRQTPIIVDSLVAFWTHLSTATESRLLFVESADYGWWYVCPDDQNGVIACLVTDAQCARELCPTESSSWNTLFRSTALQQGLEGNPSAKCVQVAPINLASLPNKHGQGWAAVGDAAVKLDPLGSSGTITALDSGQRVGRAIAEALQGNNTSLERYGRWSTGLFEEFIRQREQQYAIEGSKRHTEFWSRRLCESAQNIGASSQGLNPVRPVMESW